MGRGRQRSGRQTKVIITVPAAALRRGHTADGEMCTIAGVGQVPLETVRAYIPDAHLAYVIADARDVAVAHLGRQSTVHQRTALEARGYECAVPDCRSSHLLEIDHVRDWAFSRQTVLADLDWLCSTHHDRKTRHGHHLTGPPGRRTWHAPDGTPLSRPPRDRTSTDPIAGTGPVADPIARSGPVTDPHHAPTAAPAPADDPSEAPDPSEASQVRLQDLRRLPGWPGCIQPDLPALRLPDGHTLTLDGHSRLLPERPRTVADLRRRRAVRHAGWSNPPIRRHPTTADR